MVFFPPAHHRADDHVVLANENQNSDSCPPQAPASFMLPP
jgi:hypothetical protein